MVILSTLGIKFEVGAPEETFNASKRKEKKSEFTRSRILQGGLEAFACESDHYKSFMFRVNDAL